jgi:hypothetical protein
MRTSMPASDFARKFQEAQARTGRKSHSRGHSDSARKNPNAAKGDADTTPQALPIEFISAARWEGQQPPSLRWVVHQRIMRSNVAILNGDGAVGKTTIALQLAVAVSRRTETRATDWLGAVVDEGGPVMFVSAEETADEIQRRLCAILDYCGLSFGEVPNLYSHCRPGEDALLGTFGKNGIIARTPLLSAPCLWKTNWPLNPFGPVEPQE